MSARTRASSLSSTTTSVISASSLRCATPSSDTCVVKAKAMRPRLSSHTKRVSFDATSVPLPSATWEEFASASTVLTEPPFPLPGTDDRQRDLRRAEIDSNVDLKAILAAGIIEWRKEVDVGSADAS
ncbi:hypothetical protein FRB99_007673 [Tulasnella sp. 403]|nr:hypothetical protein FRB99_007673 [Tulasnella sp. 403]